MTRTLDGIQKQQFICEKLLSDPASSVARAMISTQNSDRTGDIMVAAGGDVTNYQRNPVVLWGHDAQALPVGKTQHLTVHPGKGIEAAWEWAPHPEAQTVKALWEGGFLNATSIGFRPIDYEELDAGDTFFPPMQFNRWELLEFSIVNVPCNQAALRLAYDAAGGRDALLTTLTHKSADARRLAEAVLTPVEKDASVGVVPAAEPDESQMVAVSPLPVGDDSADTPDTDDAPMDDGAMAAMSATVVATLTAIATAVANAVATALGQN